MHLKGEKLRRQVMVTLDVVLRLESHDHELASLDRVLP